MRSGLQAMAAGIVLLTACSHDPPSKVKDAPTRPPDESYETGGGHSYRVLVWKCNERNERVTMIQSCAEGLTGCGGWHVERTLCPLDQPGRDATRTVSERGLDTQSHNPIPEGSGWR